MVVNTSFPAKTVPELIAYAKANPGKINMASAGAGNPTHLAGELFQMMSGITMLHVPYRGDAPALTDLLGGQVQLYFSTEGGAIEHIRAGKLRALAVTAAKRSQAIAGHPDRGRVRSGLRGERILGDRRTQEHTCRDHWNAQQRDQCESPDPSLNAILRIGHHRLSALDRRFRQFIAAETDKWGKVVKFSGVEPG